MITSASDSLSGIHIVSIATNLPGPFAARHLLRLGASVTKVEPPGGDPARALPSWYAELTAGQHVTTLDLKSPAGQDEFLDLLSGADLLLSSMRPSAAARLGLPDMVSQTHVAHVEIVGDTEVPDQAGHDLTYQAAVGLLDPPHMPRVPWADVLGGYQATIAALDALREREHAQKAGIRKLVHRRVGLKQGVDDAAEALRFGATAPGQILSGSHPQYGMYQTRDGWIALAALEPHFHATLAKLLGNNRMRLEELFAQRSTAYWLQFANQHDLPLTAVEDRHVGR